MVGKIIVNGLLITLIHVTTHSKGQSIHDTSDAQCHDIIPYKLHCEKLNQFKGPALYLVQSINKTSRLCMHEIYIQNFFKKNM